MKKLIIIFLIVLSVLAYMQIKGWIAEGGPLLNVTNVVVPKGASLKTVAEELSRAGVIDKPWLFRIMARINGLAKHLKAGEYQFMPGISLQAAMDKIARGEVFFRRITIPEGLTSGQIMYLIANYPDLEGEIDLDVKEGELLPETYSFELGASRNSIILQARAAMQKALEEVWASRDSSLPLKDVNELLTTGGFRVSEPSEERYEAANRSYGNLCDYGGRNFVRTQFETRRPENRQSLQYLSELRFAAGTNLQSGARGAYGRCPPAAERLSVFRGRRQRRSSFCQKPE